MVSKCLSKADCDAKGAFKHFHHPFCTTLNRHKQKRTKVSNQTCSTIGSKRYDTTNGGELKALVPAFVLCGEAEVLASAFWDSDLTTTFCD